MTKHDLIGLKFKTEDYPDDIFIFGESSNENKILIIWVNHTRGSRNGNSEWTMEETNDFLKSGHWTLLNQIIYELW